MAERVKVDLLTTGYGVASMRFVDPTQGNGKEKIHASVAVIQHPRHGVTLFDTGYAPRYYTLCAKWPFSLYSRLLPAVTSHSSSCVEQLRTMGIAPADVQRIILSHFHIDHLCGLPDFPQSEVIAKEEAWSSVANRRGFAALLKIFHPDLVSPNCQESMKLLQDFADPGIGPFEFCHDLFGDGSIRLFELPGHAHGQIGALLQTQDRPVFLVADAVWSRSFVKQDLRPTLAFRMLAQNRRKARDTIVKLRELHRLYPDIEFVPTHCRKVAVREQFDAFQFGEKH